MRYSQPASGVITAYRRPPAGELALLGVAPRAESGGPATPRAARSARRADRYGRRGNLGYMLGSASSLAGIYLLGEWLTSENGGPHGAIGGGLILGGLVTLGVGLSGRAVRQAGPRRLHLISRQVCG